MTYKELLTAWGKVDKSDYHAAKESLCDLAQQWQYEFARETYYWSDLVDFEDFFCRFGERYGCLSEFRENAII